jgi:hypothetical protein
VYKERDEQTFFMIKIPPFQAKLGCINKDVDKRIWRKRRKNCEREKNQKYIFFLFKVHVTLAF